MKEITVLIANTEIKERLNLFFSRFKKAKVTMESDSVEFSLGSIWSLIIDPNPESEIIEGNMTIQKVGDSQTSLVVNFSKTKVYMGIVLQSIGFLIAIFLLTILSGTRNQAVIYLFSIGFVIFYSVAQLVVTRSTEERFLTELQDLASNNPLKVKPSRNFKLLYYAILGLAIVFGVFLGITLVSK